MHCLKPDNSGAICQYHNTEKYMQLKHVKFLTAKQNMKHVSK